MKKKLKSRRPDNDTMEAERQKRKKLKPQDKQKYRVRNIYLDEDESAELDLFDLENDQ